MGSIKDIDFLGEADEELVIASPQQRNWRGIVVALIVIGIMSGIIIAAIFILTPFGIEGEGTQLNVTLADLFSSRFQAPGPEVVEWLDDHKLWVKRYDGIELVDYETNTSTSVNLMNSESLFRYGKSNSVQVSPDGQFVILSFSPSKKTNSQTHKVFDVNTQQFENVGPRKTGDENVRVLAWNPAKDANSYAYVYENNIYYQPSSMAESRAITKDGSEDIYNGIADWIYEEEILQRPQALWWSLDGNYLAFLSIDNRKVRHASYYSYSRKQYPSVISQAYPKAGVTEFPLIKLRIWRKSDNVIRTLKIKADESHLVYLFSASWLQFEQKQILAATWANRYQNVTLISLCSFDSGECLTNYIQRYEFDENLKLWAEPEDLVIKHHTNNAYFTLLPHRMPNGNAYTHPAKIDFSLGTLTNGRERFLQCGEYDVVRINAFDEEHGLLYFTAAAPVPTQRNLFVTASSLLVNTEFPKCLSCNISQNCTFYDVQFPPSSSAHQRTKPKYVTLTCKGPGPPHVIIARLSFIDGTNELKPINEYGRNGVLENAVWKTHKFPWIKHETIKLKNGIETYVKLFLPNGINRRMEATSKFPLLVDVYAGPGSQRATEQFSYSLETFFASNPEYVVAFIDGRGSGFRGWRYRQSLYRNLGTVEVEDQINTVQELLKKYNILDAKRVGIWGWSYGGFVAAKAVERDNGTFKCAASIAPVSNFKYYDSIYVERYLGDSSGETFQRASLLNDVKAFHNTSLLLVHGTADDNVHFQNSVDFARALIDGNVHFELMIYPDESHNLGSGRFHLYNLLANFFKKCFSKRT